MSVRAATARPGGSTPAPRYFFEDPIRLLCIACTILLIFLPVIPAWLIVVTVAVSQFNGLAMVVRVFSRGRILAPPGGARGRYWTVQNLGIDSFTLSACTLLGGLLLMRVFGPAEPAAALGTLTIAVALVPDIRVCRWAMPNDPFRASRMLERGSFLRDPVKLGAILGAFVICLLDPESVFFVLISMLLLQFNSLMVLLDKYAAYVDWSREEPAKARLVAPLTRDSWRVILSVLPLVILPVRAFGGDAAGWWAAVGLTGSIVLPDIFRLLVLLYMAFCGGSKIAARRARKRLVVDMARAKLGVLTILFAVPLILSLCWRTLRGLFQALVIGARAPRPAPETPRAWNSVVR